MSFIPAFILHFLNVSSFAKVKQINLPFLAFPLYAGTLMATLEAIPKYAFLNSQDCVCLDV